MQIADYPKNEKERLRRLKELGILDSLQEQAYDDLTFLAAQICDAPIALITLLDEERQWFKSHHGLNATETPRDISFCSHAMLQDGTFIVENTLEDERFHDNPLVTGDLGIRFYAGAPLILDQDIRLGTICVIGHEQRILSESQASALEALARQVITLFEARMRVKELEKLDHMKDEFVSMVSHELRTPLTSLKGSLDILSHLKDSQEAQIESMLEIATRNADQLLAIVNDILELAKMETGKVALTQDSVNLSELMDEIVCLNQSYVQQCRCQLKLIAPTEPLIVEADRLRLTQVLSNFISNAAKFSFPDTEVVLEVTRHNDRAKVSVTNHGKGIKMEDQVQVFAKFRQLGHKQNQKFPGTGLGLNISKHIIEAHGGEIGFTSKVNEATTFYFYLDLNE